MKKWDIKLLTLSFIVLNLLFFSFVHGVFRLQLFKHTVNSEILEKLQVETLQMADEYQEIQAEAAQARTRIFAGNQNRSQLIVEQMAGLIAATWESGETAEKSGLLESLSVYDETPEHCFWIFDDQGTLILAPRGSLTDVELGNGKTLVDSVRNTPESALYLIGKGKTFQNPGYGKRIEALGWTVVSFQSWSVLERKIQGFESLKRMRTDWLIKEMGINGSAGVVDKLLRIQEYTYAQQKGHSVDDMRLEGSQPPSKLLFNKQDGIREYVVMDPVSNHGKYRQAYMHTDDTSGNTYFITQDKSGIFKGIDQRSSPLLGYLGGLSLLILIVNTAYSVREILLHKDL